MMGLVQSRPQHLLAVSPSPHSTSSCMMHCTSAQTGAVHSPRSWALCSASASSSPAAAAATTSDGAATIADSDADDACSSSPTRTTTIQDLPPLLLARILSQHLSWEDMFGSVPLVCWAWRDLSAHIAPESLLFEFDLAHNHEDGAAAQTPADGQQRSGSILRALLTAPHRLLLRATGQQQPPQQPQAGAAQPAEGAPAEPGQPASSATTGSARDPAEQHEYEMQLQNEPWARWLQQRGSRLRAFSMTITNLDSNCAVQQCALKETLLRALADSSTPAAAGPARGAGMLLLGDGSEAASGAGAPNTSTPSTSTISTPLAPAGLPVPHAGALGGLQLSSLHLKVPLFEYDVLLLANDVVSNAPLLTTLSLVGYSTSGAVKTRGSAAGRAGGPHASNGGGGGHGSGGGGGGAGGSSSGCLCKSSRRRLFARSPSLSLASSGSGSARQSDDASGAAHPSPALARMGSMRRTGMGRGGFITGSSLKQLVSAVPQLQSLTFACRQLYKLSWLAPATGLTHLSLRDCSLAGDLLTELASLPMQRLRSLDLSGSKALGGAAADAHLRLLGRIAGGRLQALDVSGWDLSVASAHSSRTLPQLATGLRALRSLKMECCGLQGWELLPGQLPDLSSLSLAGNALDAAGIASVCAIPSLRVLELGHVVPRERMLLPPGAAADPACWCGMAPMAELTSLSLAGNAWPDSSVPERGPALAFSGYRRTLRSALSRCPSLVRLDLCNAKVPYRALPILLGALSLSLTELLLDGAADGLRVGDVEALGRLAGLRLLSASGCNLRDKHAAPLSTLHGLQRLVLRDNNLGPDGLAAIVRGCQQLTLLDVGGNARLASHTWPCAGGGGTMLGMCGPPSSRQPCTRCTQCAAMQAALTTRDDLQLVRD